MRFPRASGILLHPTCLPGRFGIGDLGPEAHRFADFLCDAGQSLWQMLPLGPTGYGGSPYSCHSAFAGNPLLISPEALLAEGLLDNRDLDEFSLSHDPRVNFANVNEAKERLLEKAFANHQRTAAGNLRNRFETFVAHHRSWLEDYALFQALKNSYRGLPWTEWESALAHRETAALALAQHELSEQIDRQKFQQFLFFEQWFALKAYCNDHGIRVIGDVPIFVAHDSADVWTNRDQFKLDNRGTPTVVAGVPPDYFSATGQYWGNPIYNWERMRADDFSWWIKRVRATFQMVDVARIDHFRGFSACWEIPAGDETAERGRWVPAPGREIFTAIREKVGDVAIIAEDLGEITPEVEQLRDDFGFPGMRVLQFAFASDTKNVHLPHNYTHNTVAYTGTHDNDTTRAWFQKLIGVDSSDSAQQLDAEKQFCLKYLNTDGQEIQWDFIRAVVASVADTAIVPLQDVLGLDSEGRMNLPNSKEGNWTWRLQEPLSSDVADPLRNLSLTYGRTGN